MISVSDLVYDYPNHRALHGLSFFVEAGTITALVGPNGAGKTTLLRCLAGLDTPLSGEITIDGIDVIDRPREVHRITGFLQDFFGLYEDLTVRQCLAYFAAANRVPRRLRNDRIDRALERLQLTHVAHRKAGQLSRGQRQRVAIAQVILHEPRLLMLDEPAAGLDPEVRVKLSELLVSLREEGMTLIVSSHILSELEDYSTHMMILRSGRILEHGPLHEASRVLTGEQRRVAVRLSRPDPRLAAVLEGIEGVSGITSAPDHTEATFLLLDDDADRTRTLAALLAEGLAVCAFAETHHTLEEVYLHTVRVAESDPGAASTARGAA